MITAKTHGLLFTPPMIRAFLRLVNPKVQTRRIPAAANSLVDGDGMSAKRWAAMNFDFSRAFVDGGPSPAGNPGPYIQVPARHVTPNGTVYAWHRIYPRVQPGDTLIAREGTWERPPRTAHDMREGADTWPPYVYTADGISDDERDDMIKQGWKRRNSIHMPHAAARIVRTVVGVRAERLQAISAEDAMAEGLSHLSKDSGQTYKWGIPDRDGLPGMDDDGWPWALWHVDPVAAYRQLWIQLHGVASLNANPITWAYDLQPAGAT